MPAKEFSLLLATKNFAPEKSVNSEISKSVKVENSFPLHLKTFNS